jgi:hypothetical protein
MEENMLSKIGKIFKKIPPFNKTNYVFAIRSEKNLFDNFVISTKEGYDKANELAWAFVEEKYGEEIENDNIVLKVIEEY